MKSPRGLSLVELGAPQQAPVLPALPATHGRHACLGFCPTPATF